MATNGREGEDFPFFQLPNHWVLRGRLRRELKRILRAGGSVIRQSDEITVVRLPPEARKPPKPPPVRTPEQKAKRELERTLAGVGLYPTEPGKRLIVAKESLTALDENADTDYIADVVRYGLGLLARRARAGDADSASLFTFLAAEAGEGLSQMVRRNPKIVKPAAEELTRFPLMASRSPRNSDPRQWLETLGVGAHVPLQLDQFSKSKPDQAYVIAIRLIEHLHSVRQEDLIIEDADGVEKKVADALPPFTQCSAEIWWRFAREFLLRTYPRPCEVDEFKKLVTSPTRLKSPGRMNEQILSKIRARFLSLAPYQS